ncbi:MAG TPA: ABC transporter permease [Longimicrobiales bacterium]
MDSSACGRWRRGRASGATWDGVILHNVLPDYFAVAGIPIREGRAFRPMERRDAPVAIVSERLARAVWGDRSPLGARIKIGRWRDEDWRTVVGASADVRNLGLANAPGFIVYEPHTQFPKRQMTLLVRSGARMGLSADELLRLVRSIDPMVPVQQPMRFEDVVLGSIDPHRRQARMATAMAGLVIVLACAGIFGVVTFQLAARRHDIAIRAALGAGPRPLVAHALGVVLRPTLGGATLGGVITVLLAYGARQAGWSPGGLETAIKAAALVSLTAALAALMPVVRAGRVDPADALRDG